MAAPRATASSKMSTRFNFVPPPEAPVFRPTDEEFKDPLAYLMKIRNIGTKTGICKIIPPKSWNPPFAVNMKEFTFTPRIQRLYELEAQSRVKLNFLSRLYKYIRSQGGDKIRVPSLCGRFLDLHALHKAVNDGGGYEKICSDHTWATVAEKLGYAGRYASALKTNYEKLLLAFDRIIASGGDIKTKRPSVDRTLHKRLRNTSSPETDNVDFSSNKELRNLRFFGPGPKAAVPQSGISKARKTEPSYPDVDTYTCKACNRGDDESNLLVCDTESCQACYHLYCLTPPLRTIPNYHWKCPDCIRSLCVQPPDPYGFPQSNKTYSLHEFGVMADAFKSDYFGRPCCEVPCSVVEQEFWRILQEYNDDIVVEYGADIHSSTQGSGFPTEDRLKNLVGTAQQLEDAKMYASDPWNLNILPLLDRSVLRFIKGNIDGMKVPWCYVGMVFSSFCWHIEDHWSYSINFNHWGEPKTWYGISRLHAEDFERAMRKHAPELFDQAPDLLHHITTNINPNILQAEGVPVYRTDQYCGEFVVTFPRAYHAGFNQGFNFAEAVNICLPDWLPIGRACIDHYAVMKRHCVFSNEELLCTLAEVAVGRCRPEDVVYLTNPYNPKHGSVQKGSPRLPPGCSTAGLDISAIATVHQEFNLLLAKERRLRQIALNVGVVRMEKVRFDELADDVRVCDACLTTLFLSGISCPCASLVTSPKKTSPRSDTVPSRKRHASEGDDEEEQPEEKNNSFEVKNFKKERTRRFMVCLQHFDQLCPNCAPSACTLRYHYTIEELEDLECALARCSNAFYDWRAPLTQLLKNFQWTSSFLQTEKPDPESDLSEPTKPDENSSVSDQCIMTVTELKNRLDIGRAAGYHVDEVFTQAQSLFERANKLVLTCASVKAALTSSADSNPVDQQNDKASTVGFLLRIPTSLTPTVESAKQHTPSVSLHHEIDLNNPRELDVVRLMEACKQQYPINLMAEPDVWFIQDALNFLTIWRQSVREAIGAVCRLTLTTATRSLTTHCSPNVTSPLLVDVSAITSLASSGNAHTSSNDGVAFLLLSDVVESLAKKYPRFASCLPEWSALDVLRNAFKWMCVYQRQTDEQHKYPWTYPRLRQHFNQGEHLLLQLNPLSNTGTKSPSKTPPSVRASPNSPSNPGALCIELISAPVPRLLRARMRTAVGQLSQAALQVESLVGILIELLSLPGTFSCPEVLIVLGQIQSLRVSHLTQWDSSVSDKGKESSSGSPQKSPEDSKTVRLNQELVQHCLPETFVQISSLMSPLCSLLSERIRCLLGSVTVSSAVASRPQLVEAEVLLAIGLLLDRLPGDTNCDDATLPNDLSSDMGQLNSLIATTRAASSRLWEAFLATRSDDQSDNAPLVRTLLPKFPTDADNDTCFYEFMDAYAKSPPDAVDTYDAQTLKSRKYLADLLEQSVKDASSCSSCSERLAIQTSSSLDSATQCPFCPLIPNHSTCVSQESLTHLNTLWALASTNDSQTKPLCTPQAVAFDAFTKQLDAWLTELAELLHSVSTTLERVWAKIDDPKLLNLPASVQSVVDTITPISNESTLSNEDTDPMLIQQLRALLLIGSTFPAELDSLLNFLKQLVAAL